ncbi:MULTISPECIES: hypothetical protein [unclassified Synechococcus]
MTSRHLEGYGPAPEDGDAGRLRDEIETRRLYAVKSRKVQPAEVGRE